MANRKEITPLLKACLDSIELGEGLKKKKKGNLVKLLETDLEIGTIGFSIVSSKFSEYGSNCGVQFVSSVINGPIISKVRSLQLEYDNYFHEDHFYSFSSLSHFQNKFFNKGTASIFEHDDPRMKSKLICSKLKELYLGEINNFLLCKEEGILDILNNPYNYGKPLAYMLAINNIRGLNNFDQIIQEAKSRKIYDSKKSMLNELLQKIKINW